MLYSDIGQQVALVSLEAAKRQLDIEIDDTGQDAHIKALILSASEYLDGSRGIVGRWLCPRTVTVLSAPGDFVGHRAYESCAGALWLRLGLPAVRSITSVNVVTAGVPGEVPAGGWRLGREPTGVGLPRLVVEDQSLWPAIDTREDAIRIVMQVGHVSVEDVPQGLQHAVLMMVSTLYNNPDTFTRGGPAEFPGGFSALIAPHRLITIF